MLISIKKIINNIFNFIKLKRNFIFIKISKLSLNILNIFWTINLIKGYFIKNNKIKILINFNKNEYPIFKKVKFFSIKRSKFFISKKKITLFLNKLNFFCLIMVYNKLFLLKDFLKQKKRGFVLCKFY